MAKVGTQDGAYDPFKQISSSLEELAGDPAESPPPPPPAQKARPERRQAAASESVVVEQKPVPAAPQSREVNGAGGAEPEQPKRVSAASSLATVKRFKTTREEAQRLERAAAKLGVQLGVTLDFSKLTRALWDAYLRHEDDILRNVPDDETWERPPNNDPVKLAELDERLADLINDGLMVASRRPKNMR